MKIPDLLMIPVWKLSSRYHRTRSRLTVRRINKLYRQAQNQCSETLKTPNGNSYRCHKPASHDGRHESPYGQELKVFWPWKLE